MNPQTQADMQSRRGKILEVTSRERGTVLTKLRLVKRQVGSRLEEHVWALPLSLYSRDVISFARKFLALLRNPAEGPSQLAWPRVRHSCFSKTEEGGWGVASLRPTDVGHLGWLHSPGLGSHGSWLLLFL